MSLEKINSSFGGSPDALRTMIEQIPILAWSCRVDGTAEFLNQTWLDYTGLSLNEGLGWGWKSAIHPDDLAKLMATWLDLLATGAQGQEEARLRRFDGIYRWFLFRAVPVRDDRGKVIRWYGTNTDIEELKRAEEAVRGAKARLEGVLEIAQDAIISVGSNQRIILFNQGAEKIFGYTRPEILGKPLDLLLPKRFADLHRKHIEEFARSPDVARTMGQRQEVSGRRKDGSEFPAEASISKLDLNGDVVFTAILRDITERKRTERRLLAQHTITQLLAQAATLEEATPKILKTVCDLLLWDLGTLWNIDRQAGVLGCIEIWHNKSMEVTQFEAITRESTFAQGIGLPGRVWSSREPAYIADVVDDANFLRAAVAHREGLHSAFAFPILLGAEVLGVLDFFSHETRRPDQELLDMMATLGACRRKF